MALVFFLHTKSTFCNDLLYLLEKTYILEDNHCKTVISNAVGKRSISFLSLLALFCINLGDSLIHHKFVIKFMT